MTFMAPGEHLDGTAAERAHLHLLLACFRASPPPMRLPQVTGRPLPEVLAAGIIDPEVFRAGHAIMAARYEQLGIRALLPLERVRVGTCSATSTARPRPQLRLPHWTWSAPNRSSQRPGNRPLQAGAIPKLRMLMAPPPGRRA